MNTELVSVIIPTYKRPEKLADAVQSVLAQDYPSIEVIVVDDNNPENYRDKVFSTLSGTSNVSADATTYYFRKYGFHIYDITVYNAIKSDYPDYLVQNIKDTDQAE